METVLDWCNVIGTYAVAIIGAAVLVVAATAAIFWALEECLAVIELKSAFAEFLVNRWKSRPKRHPETDEQTG